ncbi:MAG: lipoyl synthase [Candidatus Melainabacteria bacterium GWF2_37_15]|nr:MAG: lipoyl synthase [Candidatus Melainabacteria bacterium GWF2_37_15]
MQRQRLPHWLKKDIINTEKTRLVRKILRESGLNTVCDGARCPNKGECYANNTATFMILGNTCTRNCKFCSVNSSKPELVNPEEPFLVAKAIKELGIRYAVITSVTRDDLKDGGAEHFALTIREIKKLNHDVKVEVLTPDFKGDKKAIDTILEAEPDVFNHNIETVKRLYSVARPQADYQRSLKFLKYINIPTKSGLMVGLGETWEEIIELLQDLKDAGCDIVTIGQYIQPTKSNLAVEKYYTPEEFESFKAEALKIGIKHPVSAPLVRSSYRAGEIIKHLV